MSDLRDLYQDLILDHQRSPRNFRCLSDAHRQAEGRNPLCGDKVTVYVRLEGENCAEITFQGEGCAICIASASLMTEQLSGKNQTEVENSFNALHKVLVEGENTALSSLGKLQVLAGVKDFPTRVKCATLAWHALRAALRHETKVSTE